MAWRFDVSKSLTCKCSPSFTFELWKIVTKTGQTKPRMLR